VAQEPLTPGIVRSAAGNFGEFAEGASSRFAKGAAAPGIIHNIYAIISTIDQVAFKTLTTNHRFNTPQILKKTIGAALLFAASVATSFGFMPNPQPDNLVVNGGFEAGDVGWDFSGPDGPYTQFFLSEHARTGDLAASVSSYYDGYDGYEGYYSRIAQYLPTVEGQTYDLDFWIDNPTLVGGGLVVFWNGMPVVWEQPLQPTEGFTNYHFTLQSGSEGTLLQIYGYSSSSQWYLDDVSVRLAEPVAPKDNVPPAITLEGGETIVIPLHAQFNDPSATALDDVSGALEVQTTGTVYTDERGEYTLTYSATDAAGNTASVNRLVIVASEAPVAVNDAVTCTRLFTTVYPLANDFDGNGDVLSLVSVSDESIQIHDRALFIPPDFSGTFTYTMTDGETYATAQVEVTAAQGVRNATRFRGLLYNEAGEVVGWSATTVSAKGLATTQLTVGVTRAQAIFIFKPGLESATASTSLGMVTLQRLPDGSMGLTLAQQGQSLNSSEPSEPSEPSYIYGPLRPNATKVKAAKHHIALASIHRDIPGAGYLIASVKPSGTVSLSGMLPDGRPFTAATSISDNGTIAFYTTETRGILSAGVLGGELVSADLAETDVTGELMWSKPEQAAGAKGLHRAGVDTVLTANGCVYAGQIPLNGPGDLTIGGSNFKGDVVSSVNVAGGIPQLGGALKAWDSVKPMFGQFRVKVQVPGIAKAVAGQGLYLPKSNRAWGYFPGTTIGGRIELRTQATQPL
jgi:hypothetical protein